MLYVHLQSKGVGCPFNRLDLIFKCFWDKGILDLGGKECPNLLIDALKHMLYHFVKKQNHVLAGAIRACGQEAWQLSLDFR